MIELLWYPAPIMTLKLVMEWEQNFHLNGETQLQLVCLRLLHYACFIIHLLSFVIELIPVVIHSKNNTDSVLVMWVYSIFAYM